MTAPVPEPDREALRKSLVAMIHDAMCPYQDCREDPSTYPAGEYALADRILARWRLVPVKHPRHDYTGAQDSVCQCWDAGFEQGWEDGHNEI